jgi:Domain of unknown function (DUF4160)
VPEIARFYGIIIRMFAEPGAPHHRPHFQAYYQNQVGIYAIDRIECIGGEFRKPKSGSWRRGLNCTGPNSWRTGAGSKPAGGRSGSRRSVREDTSHGTSGLPGNRL